MYSCNKITKTWIQISGQNWFGTFSNISHQMTYWLIPIVSRTDYGRPVRNSQHILCVSYFITTVATTFYICDDIQPAVKTVSRNTYVSLCTQKFNWETDRWAEWEAFVLSFIDLLVKLDRDSNRMNSLLIWTENMLWLSSQFELDFNDT